MPNDHQMSSYMQPREMEVPRSDNPPRPTLREYLEPSAVDEVREALEQEWSQDKFYEYQQRICNIWSHPRPDNARFRLLHPKDRMLGLEGHTSQESSPFEEELRFPNKAIVFFWVESAPTPYGGVILGGIWHTWYAATGQKPDFLLDTFFATPVFIGPDIADSVPEIVQAHKNIFATLQGAQERLKRNGHPNRQHKSDPRHFQIHPICGALIALYDKYEHAVPRIRKDENGFLNCVDLAKEQSVLLVRTGNEDRLIAPINFGPLRPHALPLSRAEDMEGLEFIRVPLLAAVQFVADLYLREKHAELPPHNKEEGPIRNIFEEPDVLSEAFGRQYLLREKIRTMEIARLSMPMATAEEVRKRLRITSEELEADAKTPQEFPVPSQFGWC